MTWLISKLSSALGPYIIGALILVILGMAGTIGWQAWTNHSLRTDIAELRSTLDKERLQAAKDLLDANAKTREIERQAREDAAKAQQQHQQEIAREKAATQKLLADYRNGALKLRDGIFSATGCSGLSGAGADTSGSGAGGSSSACGLQRAFIESLIRLADDANAKVGLLNECRTQLAIDRRGKAH